MEFVELKSKFEEMNSYYEKELAKKEAARLNLQKEEEIEAELNARVDKILAEKEMLEKATEKGREKAKTLMENIMTEALQIVLSDKKKVSMKLTTRDGTPAVNLYVQTEFDKDEVLESTTANGSGGVRDMLSMAALTSMRMLEKNNNKAPMFLDEPFKNVSRDYAESTAEFTKRMVDYFGGQFFIVTHERDVMPNIADRTFLVSKDANECSIVEVVNTEESKKKTAKV